VTDLDAALFTRLSTYSPLVTALVPATHIAAVTIKQGILVPYVVFQEIDDIPDYAHDGQNGLRHPRMQISSYASSLLGAKAINVQVMAALETWPAATPDVQSVQIENTIPMYDQATALFAMITDFTIYFLN
jgi:hypothetical protein